MARAISRQDRADFHARPAQAPAPISKKAVSFSSARNNETLTVAMRVNCEVRVLARQPLNQRSAVRFQISFFAKEIQQNGRAFLLENTGRDFAMMIQRWMLK